MNRKEFVVILVITFLVIMVWIVSEIARSKPSVPIDPKLNSLLDPIDPLFNQDTLGKIKQRKDP